MYPITNNHTTHETMLCKPEMNLNSFAFHQFNGHAMYYVAIDAMLLTLSFISKFISHNKLVSYTAGFIPPHSLNCAYSKHGSIRDSSV